MGMDVFGKTPTSKEGAYFRASVWEWLPLYERMAALCDGSLDSQTLDGMRYNSGFGPDDPVVCREMADRLDAWLATYPGDYHSVDSDMKVTLEGRLVSDAELASQPTLATRSPYRITCESIREWILFLRHCGGFEVW